MSSHKRTNKWPRALPPPCPAFFPVGCASLHAWGGPGIASAWQSLSIPINHPPIALRRVGDLLGTEAVFCGLPSGGSRRGGGGTLCLLSATGDQDGGDEIAKRPPRMKWLLVYMLIFAKSFSGKKNTNVFRAPIVKPIK